jgi:hypothetical protein
MRMPSADRTEGLPPRKLSGALAHLPQHLPRASLSAQADLGVRHAPHSFQQVGDGQKDECQRRREGQQVRSERARAQGHALNATGMLYPLSQIPHQRGVEGP